MLFVIGDERQTNRLAFYGRELHLYRTVRTDSLTSPCCSRANGKPGSVKCDTGHARLRLEPVRRPRHDCVLQIRWKTRGSKLVIDLMSLRSSNLAYLDGN